MLQNFYYDFFFNGDIIHSQNCIALNSMHDSSSLKTAWPSIKTDFSFVYEIEINSQTSALKCLFSLIFKRIKYHFLLSSICIRRKYWIRENFRLPVFDGFTCFEMSWTRQFFENVCLSVCIILWTLYLKN